MKKTILFITVCSCLCNTSYNVFSQSPQKASTPTSDTGKAGASAKSATPDSTTSKALSSFKKTVSADSSKMTEMDSVIKSHIDSILGGKETIDTNYYFTKRLDTIPVYTLRSKYSTQELHRDRYRQDSIVCHLTKEIGLETNTIKKYNSLLATLGKYLVSTNKKQKSDEALNKNDAKIQDSLSQFLKIQKVISAHYGYPNTVRYVKKNLDTAKALLDTYLSKNGKEKTLLQVDSQLKRAAASTGKNMQSEADSAYKQLKADSLIAQNSLTSMNKKINLEDTTLSQDKKRLEEINDSLKSIIPPLKQRDTSLIIVQRDLLDKIAIAITKVNFYYSYGNMLDITITTKKIEGYEKFDILRDKPITVNSFRDVKKYRDVKIYLPEEQFANDSTHYIYLSDVIRVGQYYDKSSDKFNLDSVKKNPKSIPPVYITDRPANTYFYVNISSDLISLLSNQSANGRVQMEFDGYFNLGNRHKAFNFFKNFDPTVGITKIGLSNSFINLDSAAVSSKVIKTTEILQYSSLNFGARLNIFTWNIGDARTAYVYFNYRARYFQTPFSYHDTITRLGSVSHEFEIISYLYFARDKIKVVPSFTFMDFHFLGSLMNLSQDDYTPISAYHRELIDQTFVDFLHNMVVVPQMIIYYSPTGATDNCIFFQSSYSYRNGMQSEGFMQAQIGTTINITKIISLFSISKSK